MFEWHTVNYLTSQLDLQSCPMPIMVDNHGEVLVIPTAHSALQIIFLNYQDPDLQYNSTINSNKKENKKQKRSKRTRRKSLLISLSMFQKLSVYYLHLKGIKSVIAI